MGNGLREQLLKAGLVTEKQLRKAQQEKRREDRQKPRRPQEDEARIEARKAAAEKAERDRQLNLQRQREAERKAVTAQVRQLIEAHREDPGDSDTPFNFTDGSRVKRLYLSDRARDRVVGGQWAIVRLDGRYELVPAEIADKIRSRDPAAVVLQNDPRQEQKKAEADDPYAAFQVPDDLIW